MFFRDFTLSSTRVPGGAIRYRQGGAGPALLFAVGAPDRGARVAHRLALDHADRVTKPAVLDIVPTLEHFARANMAFAVCYYH